MVGRVPCEACNLQSSSPNNFLLVCACGLACHHRCLKPPISYSSLLVMIDAFNRGIHEKSIHSWRCVACISTAGKLENQSRPPTSAQSLTLVDGEVRYNPGPHDKKSIASRRGHGWRKNAPAPMKHLQSRRHLHSSVAPWPPVRHINKTHTHPSAAKDIREPARDATSLKVNVVPTGQVESTYSLKPFSSLHPPATKVPRPRPKLDPLQTTGFVVKTPPSSKLRVSKLRNPVSVSLASSSLPDVSTSAQTRATIDTDHNIPPATRKSVVNYLHVVENIPITDHLITTSRNTLLKDANEVEDIFIDCHPGNGTGSRNEIVTQVSFPVLPSTNARGLYDFPSSPTAPGRPNQSKCLPDAMIQSMSGEKADHTPSVVTTPQWRPPLVDLHKALKRKRSIARRNTSATTIGSNPGVSESRWDIADDSRQDSGFDGYLLKRRKLDMGNTEKPEIQSSGGRVDVPTQEQNLPVLATEGKHIKSVDPAPLLKARTEEQPQGNSFIDKAKRRKLDVQTCQITSTSHPRLLSPDTKTRYPNTDHHTIEEPNQMPQLASPATSHRSVEALPPDDSTSREPKPVPPPITVVERIFPIHNQRATESQLLPPLSLLTPRSLSPTRHIVLGSVLDDVVARLQSQNHHRNQLRPPKLPNSQAKFPRLAKWFKELGTNLNSTGTREKRKRWKTPNAKALVVGLNDGWSFIGAHVRTR